MNNHNLTLTDRKVLTEARTSLEQQVSLTVRCYRLIGSIVVNYILNGQSNVNWEEYS